MIRTWLCVAAIVILTPLRLLASGHGPVFGAATPTLGRGGWSVDQAYTFRGGDDQVKSQQMFKTMISFGITETIQLSGSVPLAMSDGVFPSRMMSAMSSAREVEGLLAYRFQRRTIGIGGRQESTVYVGGSPSSIVVQAATGYASRAHYLWIGGGVEDKSGFMTFVYGYRPPPLQVEAGRPDLRFFVEAMGGSGGVFVGPTSLLVYKAIAVEGGVLFAAHQAEGQPRERMRVAVNFAYFFWLK